MLYGEHLQDLRDDQMGRPMEESEMQGDTSSSITLPLLVWVPQNGKK